MPTDAGRAAPKGLTVKKGDTVQVITGKDRGAKGRVIATYPRMEKVLVEGVNRIRKHTKVTTTARGAQSGGIVVQEAPVHRSNVMVVCPHCNKRTRVAHRRDEDRNVRICKRCGGVL
jgi:large subunit ribosomal protein L24